MKIKYLEETDTALVEFPGNEVAGTGEISGNIYIDVDAAGNLVNMTIEHAMAKANIREIAFEQMRS